jgi:uncharacterized protein (TIGR02145 family)
VVTAKAVGTATITVKTNDGAKTATCSVVVGDKISAEYVDLGLPSGLKWATCNLGASSPEEYGDYYAWGETETKTDYSWTTYKWYNGSLNTLTKYNTSSSYGTVDNITVLEEADDVAHIKLGGKWRMPTDEDWAELISQCTWLWTTMSDVKGSLVTGKNGNSIFLPAAGWRSGMSLSNAGDRGHYWSSSLDGPYSYCAFFMYFYIGNIDRSAERRCYGISVRPVIE